jgi:hypothetical protein
MVADIIIMKFKEKVVIWQYMPPPRREWGGKGRWWFTFGETHITKHLVKLINLTSMNVTPIYGNTLELVKKVEGV